MSNYWAHAWYLLETLKESTSMYNGNYSEHLTNNGVLTSNFVPIKGSALDSLSLNCLVVLK
ncbi:hypothetical protein T01_12422 [Trichinella spiralis]|uniref:Uncharacterized protein n=1 Tax=Trichinella spiralis TaxID=6334 RepID=A0A0V1AWH9_TRISP|nr:hypothetical protein T01_12422 [Trichinella spiralis]